MQINCWNLRDSIWVFADFEKINKKYKTYVCVHIHGDNKLTQEEINKLKRLEDITSNTKEELKEIYKNYLGDNK